MKQCARCNNEYVPTKPHQKYCSKRCAGRDAGNRYLDKKYQKIGGRKFTRVAWVDSKCPICGKEYKNSTKRPKKTCSLKCGNEIKKKKWKCGTCKKIMTYAEYGRNRKYCSKKCCDKAWLKRSIKKQSENRYRTNAFNCYEHKCSDCGYSEHIEILVVHHCDGNRKNGALDNLVILCPNCHAIRHWSHLTEKLGFPIMQAAMSAQQGQENSSQASQSATR